MFHTKNCYVFPPERAVSPRDASPNREARASASNFVTRGPFETLGGGHAHKLTTQPRTEDRRAGRFPAESRSPA